MNRSRERNELGTVRRNHQGNDEGSWVCYLVGHGRYFHLFHERQ